MPQKDRFSALERALPFAAIAETVLTRGKSPGTTSLGQLDRVDKLREQDRQIARQSGLDQRQAKLDNSTALGRSLTQRKTQQGLDAADELEEKAAQNKATNVALRNRRKNGDFADIVKTEADKVSFNKDPLGFLDDISSSFRKGEDAQSKLDRAAAQATAQQNARNQGFINQQSLQQSAVDAASQKDIDKLERDQENLKKSVNGYSSNNPDLFVEKAEIGTFKKAIFQSAKLRPKLNEIINLIETEGNQVFGAKSDILRGKLKDIQLDVKGPEMAALGVLAGPDVEILTDVTGDPTSFINALFSLGDTNPALSKMKSLRATLNRNEVTQGSQLGLIPTFATAEAAERRGFPAGTNIIVDGRPAIVE